MAGGTSAVLEGATGPDCSQGTPDTADGGNELHPPTTPPAAAAGRKGSKKRKDEVEVQPNHVCSLSIFGKYGI